MTKTNHNLKIKNLFIAITCAALTSTAFAQEQDGDDEDTEGVSVPSIEVSKTDMCDTSITERGEEFANNFVPDVCASINKNPDPKESKFAYESPEAEGCDLGMQLPGLPDFGDLGDYSGLKLDSCEITQAITGDMVEKSNSYVEQYEDFKDEGMESLNEETNLDQYLPTTDDMTDEAEGWVE